MDKFISTFKAQADGDLMLCHGMGVAYQADMSVGRVPYDADYLAKCQSYEGSEIAKAVNDGRCNLVLRHVPAGGLLLDIGAGTGAFVRAAIKRGFVAFGFDVIPETAAALRAAEMYAEDVEGFDAVCFWDSIEHMEDPGGALAPVHAGATVFVSIPVFEDLADVRFSKHYRPGEHLHHWTPAGFVCWMALHGFMLLEMSDHEVKAGRESIGAFAFRKVA